MVEVEIGDQKRGGNKRWRWAAFAAVIVVLLAAALNPNRRLCSSRIKAESRRYTGIVEDCCCEYETVDSLNGAVLNPLLQELVTTPFFRPTTEILADKDAPLGVLVVFDAPVWKLYKSMMVLLEGRTTDMLEQVKLWCDCPFWPDDGMCRLRDCSVCECPENEFPESFKAPSKRGLLSDDLVCQEGKPQATVDRTLDTKAFTGWIEIDNPWTHEDETDNAISPSLALKVHVVVSLVEKIIEVKLRIFSSIFSSAGEMTYVNLQLNPERYTGYTGPSARRIWDAIYSENCPKYSSGEICQEKKVLYKLISGLHSSISIHIAVDYLLDESANLWGQNLELMHNRVLRHPDRVRNLYFTFLFVLRAVTKAADYLEHAEYDTGNHAEDLKAQSLMRQLLYNPKLQAACPLPFDDAKLWQGQSGPELKQQIQKQFRNISALMDCVGCEKCRLWGKLQVLGLGTALKILFSVDGQNHQDPPLQLQRNEVIALVNLLNRLSESVKVVNELVPSIEGLVSEPPVQDISAWQRIWESVGLCLEAYTLKINRCSLLICAHAPRHFRKSEIPFQNSGKTCLVAKVAYSRFTTAKTKNLQDLYYWLAGDTTTLETLLSALHRLQGDMPIACSTPA
ncbi:hypothetical protein RJ639_005690 [Escallonia herrerae]|uniref:Uncharacterized protein n=1 Tax=Escallonia herrerae TaxID=1293975 RepID=A0AA89AU35_9ASTE|nr:hypothetical protein RJ639_005690 [Escallonia herrerae]